jgi:two-component system response regulator DesR
MGGAISAILSKEHDLDVVGELGRPDDLLSFAVREHPEVVVLDQFVSGSAELDRLCRKVSGSGVLVVFDRQTFTATGRSLVRLAPRVGLIATDASPAELVEAVRQIARGRPVLDVGLAVAALTAGDNPLTHRELEVLKLVRTGATAQEVARILFLSTGTVRNHLSHILAKTGARTRIEAIRKAQEAGWI